MKVESLASAEEFLTATEELRLQHPVLTNVMGSIAAGVAAGRSYEKCKWWVAIDGDVVGAAVRTAPYQVVLSPMPTEAVSALADAILNQDPDFPGVSGPLDSVDAFVAATPFTYINGMDQLIYVLEELKAPRVIGVARSSTSSDVDLVLAWHHDFIAEAGLLASTDTDYLSKQISDGRYLLWEVDGDAVSMASNAPIIATSDLRIGRVGPVYTPPDQRRQGFGAAVTAAVTQRLIDDGCTTIMLYTDASNPISNSIYQQIGYLQVDQWVERKRI